MKTRVPEAGAKNVVPGRGAWPASVDTEDDAAVLRRVALRDDAALETLYTRHAPVMLGLATQILRRPDWGEEVVQETFVHVWQSARQYDASRATVLAWLVMLTRSRAVDRSRAESARLRASTVQARIEAPVSDGAAAPTPDAAFDERVRRDGVGKALASLPAEQQLALSLAFYEGLSQSEIAERLGEPLGTVKTRLRRGLERLSSLLANEEPPARD